MPKMKLDLDKLAVDSFEVTGGGGRDRGTVRGYVEVGEYSYFCNDFTYVCMLAACTFEIYASCDTQHRTFYACGDDTTTTAEDNSRQWCGGGLTYGDGCLTGSDFTIYCTADADCW